MQVPAASTLYQLQVQAQSVGRVTASYNFVVEFRQQLFIEEFGPQASGVPLSVQITVRREKGFVLAEDEEPKWLPVLSSTLFGMNQATELKLEFDKSTEFTLIQLLPLSLGEPEQPFEIKLDEYAVDAATAGEHLIEISLNDLDRDRPLFY